MNPEFNLTTRTLRNFPGGKKITRILQAALNAVEPEAAIRRFVSRTDDQLIIADQVYPLNKYQRIFVCGVGKAGAPMALAIEEILGNRIHAGLVIVKDGYTMTRKPLQHIHLVEAGHPIPDERSINAGKQILELLGSLHANDLVICLISGGGSALLNAPLPPLQLSDIQEMTRLLLANGADIHTMNCLRKHLDQIKGGGLAKHVYPATLVTLVLSDVIGDRFDVIASGPTVPDLTSFLQAWEHVARLNLVAQMPGSILEILRKGVRGEIADTPKPGEKYFEKAKTILVGSNLLAAQAALVQAQVEGFNSMLLTTYLQGEARLVSRFLAAIARQMAHSEYPLPRPACVIIGGETTVTLTGNGLGGRNQELALGAVQDISGCQDTILVTLATDGGDGPTDAAGAVISGMTLAQAMQLGLEPEIFLQRNDSYHFFEALDDLLRPGPTLTNVNDLAFIFTL